MSSQQYKNMLLQQQMDAHLAMLMQSSAGLRQQHPKYYPSWVEEELSVKAVPKPRLPVSTQFGEFVGFRFWSLHRGHLKSASHSYVWLPGKVAGLTEGQKIEDYGSAGVHAFKDKSRMLLESYSGDLVFGTIKMWGDVIEYEHGYHAEFASIVSLDSVDLPSMKAHERTILDELRARYGVAPSTNEPKASGSP